MEVRHTRVSGTIRTEGGLLPADLLGRIAAGDTSVPGLAGADYGLEAGVRFGEAITRSWNRLAGAWGGFVEAQETATAGERLTTATRERFLLPLFEELGFGRLPAARAVEIEGTAYPVSHAAYSVPIHLVAADVPLDKRTPGVRGAAGAAPHALVQELLNRSEERLWGFVGNGRTLRLLRDNASLTRQAYLEFDLEAIFTGQAYADFSLLWLVCHRSRFSGARHEDWFIERWTKLAADEGTRALESLRGGVTNAIETLGIGFLAAPANAALRERLRSGSLDRQDYYRQLLRLVYRFIFLFTAEDRRDEDTGRELLLDPGADEAAVERYRRYYSTVRLRAFAVRRRGTRHGDLWAMLRRVIGALGSDEGAPSIAVPALGSFLFGPDACPDLDSAELRNEDLLAAVRQLATIEEDRRLRTVDYANLGAEELGSVYESLLELHPRLEIEATPPVFSLSTAAGHERKVTGSYYTPSSLIDCLLDSALDPVLDEAAASEDPEAAILGLAVVDPAAGSGHFLVAAAHRIAKRLAAARTGEGEPPPPAVRHALRDVISHCIYAVDLNPMAIELCKVSLWLEALEPGKPLTFLDAHIKSGNSLLGTTPELVEAGIPDEAFKPITGDDKAIARAWRDRNRKAREGQQTLFDTAFELPVAELAQGAAGVDALADDDPDALRAKEERNRRYLGSDAYRRAKLAADAWCAAFVVPKTADAPEVTTTTVRAFGSGANVGPDVEALVADTARDYAFFHWPLEFPQVFSQGGFDVVLGNPPWERVKLQEREFFAERSPAIAGARNAAERKRMIVALAHDDPALHREFQQALRRSDGESHLLRDSQMYPLSGRGDINTYVVFAEAMRSVVAPRGRAGVIVPMGIATDDTTKYFFGDLIDAGGLVSLYSFENEEFVFPSVHHAYRFSLMTMAGTSSRHETVDLVFYARQVSWLDDPDRHFSLTPEEFALLNPNTGTCPTFRSKLDAEIAKDVYRRIPVLIDHGDPAGNPWGITFLRMFDMANDSHLFRDNPGVDRSPLYEAKLLHQYTHRWSTYDGPEARDMSLEELQDPTRSTNPRYWVDQGEVEARLQDRWTRGWLLAFRNIVRAHDARTVIATAIPRVAVAHSAPVLLAGHSYFPLLIANLNSFAFDWQARQKVGGINLTFGLFEQLPVLPPAIYASPTPWSRESLADWLRRYVAELAFTAWDLRPYAQDLGWTGHPYSWDVERRAQLRAELDAAFFHLYGLSRDHAEHIMESFHVVREREQKANGHFRTKDLVLGAYDAMSEATQDRPFVSVLRPAPGDPSVDHAQSVGETAGSWVPWTEPAL